MAEREGLSLITIITVALATPTTLMLSYFVMTNDHTYRPLAISTETLEVSATGRPRLRAFIDVPADESVRGANAEFANAIKAAFRGRGLDVPVIVEQQSQLRSPTVTYRVGSSRLGPFPAEDAAAGVRAATQAYWMQAKRADAAGN